MGNPDIENQAHKEGKQRDPYKPFKAAELEEMRSLHYPKATSFRATDWSIGAADVPSVMRPYGFYHTPEQLEVNAALWDVGFEGRAPWPVLGAILASIHDPLALMRAMVAACDKNGNGFIDRDEYKIVFAGLRSLFGTDVKFSFEEFVAAADTNADGKVSIDEAVEWAAKQQQRQEAAVAK